MPIYLRRRQPDDTFANPILVERAFFLKGEDTADLTEGVRIKQRQRVWKIVPSDLDGEPHPDDVIEEVRSGTRWSVDWVNDDELGQFYLTGTTREV